MRDFKETDFITRPAIGSKNTRRPNPEFCSKQKNERKKIQLEKVKK